MTTPANPTAPQPKEPTGTQADAVPITRATSTATATGAALATADQEIPQGEDRGSKTPIKGDPKPDKDAPSPTGAQAEPARFTSNGQVPHRTVATPSGPVPAGALKGSKESIERKMDEQAQAHDDFVAERNSRDRRLTQAEINKASGAELRAIGQHRGYKLPDYAGTRVVRTAFGDQQEKDNNLPTEKK